MTETFPMEKIKIAQIGVCHEHASGKITALRRLPELFEIVGVVDDNATSTTPKFSGKNLQPYEGLKWMTEEEVLNYPGLQAVAVEVPNNELVPTALRCMEHNLAMHMDKPAGEDLALPQQLLSQMDSLPPHKVIKGKACSLFEHSGIISAAQPYIFRHSLCL